MQLYLVIGDSSVADEGERVIHQWIPGFPRAVTRRSTSAAKATVVATCAIGYILSRRQLK